MVNRQFRLLPHPSLPLRNRCRMLVESRELRIEFLRVRLPQVWWEGRRNRIVLKTRSCLRRKVQRSFLMRLNSRKGWIFRRTIIPTLLSLMMMRFTQKRQKGVSRPFRRCPVQGIKIHCYANWIGFARKNGHRQVGEGRYEHRWAGRISHPFETCQASSSCFSSSCSQPTSVWKLSEAICRESKLQWGEALRKLSQWSPLGIDGVSLSQVWWEQSVQHAAWRWGWPPLVPFSSSHTKTWFPSSPRTTCSSRSSTDECSSSLHAMVKIVQRSSLCSSVPFCVRSVRVLKMNVSFIHCWWRFRIRRSTGRTFREL